MSRLKINTAKPLLRLMYLISSISLAPFSQADDWDLQHIPLHLLSDPPPPNIFITLDDSCSMWVEWTERGVILDTLNYNHTLEYTDKAPTGTLSASYPQPLSYPDSRGWGNYKMVHTQTHIIQSHNEWYRLDWRRLSANAFEPYYDPKKTYDPWVGFDDADFNAAHYFAHTSINPTDYSENHRKTFDLNTHDGFKFHIYRESRVNLTTKIDRNGDGDTTDTSDFMGLITPRLGLGRTDPGTYDEATAETGIVDDVTQIDLWDDYVEYTVTKPADASSPAQIVRREIKFNVPYLHIGADKRYDCNANSHKSDPPYASCLGATVVNTTTFNAGTATDLVFGNTVEWHLQNIANWFQYHRHPMAQSKAAIAETINDRKAFNWGGQLMVDNGNPNRQKQDGTSFPAGDERVFIPIPKDNARDNKLSERATQADSVLRAMLEANSASNCTTSTQDAAYHVGRYFKDSVQYQTHEDTGWTTHDTTSPIFNACQQNFHVLVTDGGWTTAVKFDSLNDENGDGYNATFSDIATYFYETDLRADLSDLVPTNSFNNQPAQHLSQFVVGLNFNRDGLDHVDGWPVGLSASPSPSPAQINEIWWGTGANKLDPFSSDGDIKRAARIRDHWRAAYESRGRYEPVTNASTGLAGAFDDIDRRVSDRYSGSSAAARGLGGANSNQILSTSFQASNFETKLKVRNLDSTGGLSGGESTKILFLGRDTARHIYTSKPAHSTPAGSGSYTGITFTATQADLDALVTPSSVDGAVDAAYADDLINYVRGDQSKEGVVAGAGSRGWRIRTNILGAQGQVSVGATSHSNLAYVGAPTDIYPGGWPGHVENDNTYENFVSNNASRVPMIYFGANDGMLHGFHYVPSATSLNELIAYVPHKVLNNLHNLTSNSVHTQTAFVDGRITVRDIYNHAPPNNGFWRTLLVSGLRTGGQGYFALDVTDPNDFDDGSTKANQIAMWEFTDDPSLNPLHGDLDLGDTVGQPVIARLNNGKWGVIFGNGYNNTKADGNVSTTGNAAVYIVDANTGELIKKFDTRVGTTDDPHASQSRPNGITDLTVINTFSGGTSLDYMADIIYAGDLFGNLWKIDISDTDPANWEFGIGNNVTAGVPANEAWAGEPLISLPDDSGEPISMVAAAGAKFFNNRNTEQGILVYVGTGRYFTHADRNPDNSVQNRFLAVWDLADSTLDGNSVSSRQISLTDLVEQTIDGTTGQQGNFELRFTSDNDVPYFSTDASGNASVNKRGWYLTLDKSEGERVISKAIVNEANVTFSTLLPTHNDCKSGGSSFIMRLDAQTGGPTQSAFFDLNDDEQLTDVDRNPNDLGIPSGVRKTQGDTDDSGQNSIFHENYGGTDQIYFTENDGGVGNIQTFNQHEKEGQDTYRKVN